MGPIWATHISANPYGTHAEPDSTPHMGSPYGTHNGMCAGWLFKVWWHRYGHQAMYNFKHRNNFIIACFTSRNKPSLFDVT